jgi:hypothetical protein
MSKSNGFVGYNGPSTLDGAAIQAIVTGVSHKSNNPKTDDMEQVWIMRSDIAPLAASRTGADASVCGDCSHRPIHAKQRDVEPCYVHLFQAPSQVFKTTYPLEPKTRAVPRRLSAYGEPTALPYAVALALAKGGNGKYTGYTHQWRTCDQRFRELCMASVDSEQEAHDAQAMGWRTFRVRKVTEPILAGEIMCPASKEGNYKSKCAQCLLCAGTSIKAKNIAIIEH